jgi:elongation factor G
MTMPRLLSIGITPSSEGDCARLEAGLASMMRQDPSLAIVTNGDEIIVAGIGELQLAIVIDRLKREFNVNARLGRPSVIYAETITATAVAEVKYADLRRTSTPTSKSGLSHAIRAPGMSSPTR